MLSKLIRDKSNVSFTNFGKLNEQMNGWLNNGAHLNLPQIQINNGNKFMAN